HLRPASGRQPGLPGRRAEARRPAGPRPRRAPAAPRRRPRPPTSPRPRRARGSGRARRAGWTRDRPLFRIPNPESRIPASAGGDPMSARDRLGGWVLPLSLLLALLLGLLPLHAQLQPLRPYWVALVLAYWVIETPSRAGLGLAFACGLIADLAYGSLLGEQALRLV